MKRFGLSWAATWSLGETSHDIHFTPRQRAYLSNLADSVQREHLKDFVVNRGSRSDIWCRGVAPQLSLGPIESLRAERVILIKPKDDFGYKAEGALGEIALSRALYGRLLEAMAHHKPVRIAQLEETLRDRANFPEIIEALAILVEQQ